MKSVGCVFVNLPQPPSFALPPPIPIMMALFSFSAAPRLPTVSHAVTLMGLSLYSSLAFFLHPGRLNQATSQIAHCVLYSTLQAKSRTPRRAPFGTRPHSLWCQITAFALLLHIAHCTVTTLPKDYQEKGVQLGSENEC